MSPLFVILFFSITASFAQNDPHFASGRNTIVHLFEWKWRDIADESERFLQPRGYGGVQVSPPNENLIVQPRQLWKTYQHVSYEINIRSGDEIFSGMVRRCKTAGVNIYVDAVINHMSEGAGTGIAGNNADRANKNYPAVPYSNEHFERRCVLGISPGHPNSPSTENFKLF